MRLVWIHLVELLDKKKVFLHHLECVKNTDVQKISYQDVISVSADNISSSIMSLTIMIFLLVFISFVDL